MLTMCSTRIAFCGRGKSFAPSVILQSLVCNTGKIMRRILRKIAEGEPEKLGDTSTLADPSIVDVSGFRWSQRMDESGTKRRCVS